MNSNSAVAEAQVVISGAGPTGLMLAAELRLGGVDVVVVERRAAGTVGESRAPGINARSMEVFTQRGLGEEFLNRGKVLPGVLFSGIPMAPHALDPGWPSALILPQHETERILAARAVELGVRFLWSTAVVDLNQDDDGVEVFVEGPSGPAGIRAGYLVGCDGGHSTVRRICEVPFPGDEPESFWVVGDVRLDSPPDGNGVFGRNERIGTYQISRAEPGWFRLSLMRTTPPADRTAPVTLDELREVMRDGLGTDYGLGEARWMSRFSDGFRQITDYRQGRVFLAGDAGHIHSPIGGQGLNLGIQDAVNLGWKLAAVLNGAAPDSLLDTYHQERHPIAATVLQLTKAQTALIKPGAQTDALRGVVADMLAVPETCLRLSGILSGLNLRYPLGDTHPLLGRRMPDLALSTGQGRTGVFGLLRQARPVLINLGADGLTGIPAPWADRVDYVEARLEPFSSSWDLPVFGEVPACNAVFVRPDGYVAWVNPAGAPVAHDTLTTTLGRWLGAAGTAVLGRT
ncbi:3-(3-hydroxy-phenyl)propionate hydroxylase [Amycolatopsis mediterranei S699]|uniref:3-(3-hydroxy-phenyl)propionate hydroxylase n=2 Tax=Amycolatopsis mediterranei TaxID=33910 RepID=A0A0H3D8S0_AMYMU|nr:FAD-dependent monooxygenase [Amycolatopsis mediterranei]ADJ47385.1 3-(3-hydroxy-phenyl)propionate hydroxylase [Amycolatopsis mediterranei U32]AEK44228.1 3-(3-hydroxy-phenyl)propionate hydroxylase [Amycolatopsis mediterranei S699]AFO79096.1 3-(3-hydroxy-phenyl)propionate hydroxylase [Amycolatopsis mediterranei S699]AGT86224.1 3-(3-hydroxy-phenyl)propionate hydroxylase [Amycolatopsis mediterranei RB]KDO12429.1 3-(3-hydroxyphenyl)propionate hydroxylase [Amycolatopsis mediterranei]